MYRWGTHEMNRMAKILEINGFSAEFEALDQCLLTEDELSQKVSNLLALVTEKE